MVIVILHAEIDITLAFRLADVLELMFVSEDAENDCSF